MTYKPTLIHHFLENSAERFPDKVALVHEEVRATYAEINTQANQMASWLIEQGVQSGDRVVLLLENSLEYVVGYYGALKAGAVAVPLNTELKPEGVSPLIDELECKIILTQRKYERLLRQVDIDEGCVKAIVIKDPKLDLKKNIEVFDWGHITKLSASENIVLEIDESQLASIIYTSGSTGKPKGVMLSHRNVVANVLSICQYLKLTDADIQMVVQPFFYVMGKSLLNTHMAVGGRVVINNKFAFPAAVIKQMIDEEVTGFSGVPSTYAFLLHKSPLEASRGQLTSLRYCTQAGGHMASANKLRLLEVLPEQTDLVIMYGATEASARLSYVEPSILREKVESIGQAIPGVKLKVLGNDGAEVPVNEVGELVASGENIMSGYWCDPIATDKALSQHGYHTGDLAYKDNDGYFFVVGRKDNQLKVSGHRINVQEVEDVILDSGLVVDVVVVGIPDALTENRLVAVATPSDGKVTSNDILSFCTKKIPPYKLPYSVALIEKLPQSASGKIDRKKCKELIIDKNER